jgi:hypothetical protein
MMVDTLLKYYGHNPLLYQTVSEKWSRLTIELFNTAFPIIVILLTLVPWIFYLWKRKSYQKKVHTKFLWTIVKFSIAGLLLGLFLPTLVIWISGALTIRALYGN